MKIVEIKGKKYFILSEERGLVYLKNVRGKIINIAKRLSDGSISSITPLWNTVA